MTREQVLNGLQAEKESFLAQECATVLQQYPESILKEIVQTREYLTGLYTTKLRINKSLKRSFFENEEISSWEEAIKKQNVVKFLKVHLVSHVLQSQRKKQQLRRVAKRK